VQVTLACVLVLLGSFNDILGYFVPCAVFFLGLAATAVVILPRPNTDADVFRAPLHPLPFVMFIVMVVGILGLFVTGQPRQTLLGAAVVALGIPVSWIVASRRQR
jgi:hypothetical protein